MLAPLSDFSRRTLREDRARRIHVTVPYRVDCVGVVVGVVFDEMDVEIEDFVVTEQDLLSTQGRGRRKRRFTKADATYGIWAPPHDSDEEDVTDFTKPVQFVSSGDGTFFSKREEEEEDEDSDNNEGVSCCVAFCRSLHLL